MLLLIIRWIYFSLIKGALIKGALIKDSLIKISLKLEVRLDVKANTDFKAKKHNQFSKFYLQWLLALYQCALVLLRRQQATVLLWLTIQ